MAMHGNAGYIPLSVFPLEKLHVQLQGDEQLSFENKLAFASMVGMARSSPRQMWLFWVASTSWRVLKKCLLVELFQTYHVSTAST